MEQSIDITQQDQLTFEGTVGQLFSVKMVGNVTTGYNWYLSVDNYDSSAVVCSNLGEMGNGEYKSQEPQTGGTPGMRVCGAPGFSVFNFEIKKSGEHKVVLQYKRPWEAESIKTKTLTFIA